MEINLDLVMSEALEGIRPAPLVDEDGVYYYYYKGEVIPADRSNKRFKKLCYLLHGKKHVTSSVQASEKAMTMVYQAEDNAIPARIVRHHLCDYINHRLWIHTAKGIAAIDSEGNITEDDFIINEGAVYVPGECFGDLPVYDPKINSLDVIEDAYRNVVSAFSMPESSAEVCLLYLLCIPLRRMIDLYPHLFIGGGTSSGKSFCAEQLLGLIFSKLPRVSSTIAATIRRSSNYTVMLLDDEERIIESSLNLDFLRKSAHRDRELTKSASNSDLDVVSVKLSPVLVITRILGFEIEDVANRVIELKTSQKHFNPKFDSKLIESHVQRLQKDFPSACISLIAIILKYWHNHRSTLLQAVKPYFSNNNGYDRLSEVYALLLAAAVILGDDHVKRLVEYLDHFSCEQISRPDLSVTDETNLYILRTIQAICINYNYQIFSDSTGQRITHEFDCDQKLRLTGTATDFKLMFNQVAKHFDPTKKVLFLEKKSPQSFLNDIDRLLNSDSIEGIQLIREKRTTTARNYSLVFTMDRNLVIGVEPTDPANQLKRELAFDNLPKPDLALNYSHDGLVLDFSLNNRNEKIQGNLFSCLQTDLLDEAS